MGLFTIVKSFNNYEIFRNISIILIFLFLFIKLRVGLNIILALTLALAVIWYLTERQTVTNNLEDQLFDAELKTIKPIPKKIKDDKDIIDFIFSVQDFYVFNPLAFEEVIDDIDALITLHESVFRDSELANQYYQIAESKKNNALNSFHSLIFTLPNDKIYTEKFNRAHKRLETILNKHINEMYDQCKYYIKEMGRNVLDRQINRGPKEYNHYFDKDFTYQFY